MSADSYGLPETRIARKRFDAAAATFDGADAVLAEARERLLERLELFAIEPRCVVDLGAATGAASLRLARRYPQAAVLAIDSSGAMTRVLGRKCRDLRAVVPLQADAHALPLREASVDLVFGNLLLPWTRPDRVLAEIARVLEPGGLALLTSLGPDTLVELRRAWAEVDDGIHVHGFVDMHDLGDLAVRAGLTEPVTDVDRLTVSYSSLPLLVGDLRATGSSNCAVGRRTGLTGTGRWRAFAAAFAAQARAGGPTVTVEIVYAQAWGGSRAARPEPAADGVVRIDPLALVRAARRRGPGAG
ncbi:MAG TPA: methyltransferase domain-containing protein [Gammaproteobacteria bacterium]|nr:methyltransferase domain-containing protein [Gammaproteobacteria bacterium]